MPANMKLLAESSNLEKFPVFARAYYGELIGIILSIISTGYVFTKDHKLGLVMTGVLLAHALIIWAWGRRYRGIDWLYATWAFPTVMMFSLMMFACSMNFLRRGGLGIGDGSITAFGFSAMLLALVSRGTGIYWCFISNWRDEVREPSMWPAIAILTIIVAVLMYASPELISLSFKDLAFTILAVGGNFYGIGVYL